MSQAVGVEGRAAGPRHRISAEMRGNFAVVIPALNESENIPELFQALEATFGEHGLDGEVVFVDDGSTDDTYELARKEGRRLRRFRLERHKRNLGKTEALLTGVRATRADWILLFDADLQHSPEDIPRFLAAAEEGYEIVCGRKVGKYRKRLVSGIYNWLSRRMFRVPARDLNSIKIFHRDVLSEIHLRHDWHRFFVVLAHAQGYRVGEIDVALYPRRGGSSKYRGGARVLVGVLDLLAVWFQLRVSRKPMLLFGLSGLFLLLLGGAVGLGAIVMRLMGQGFRPLLDLVLLLGIVGISLFGIGFLADMVAALRSELDELKETVRELKDNR